MTEKTRPGHVCLVANSKGGVGKTTNAVNLAHALAERGNKVLIMDIDASAGASVSFRVPDAAWNGIYELITRAEPVDGCIITEEDEEIHLPQGVHLIPSSKQVAQLNNWFHQPENIWVERQSVLQEPIRILRERYDYIMLDCPPNPEAATLLPAMKAADFAVLATQPDPLAVKALSQAIADIRFAREQGNPRLTLLGVIVGAVPHPMTVLARELLRFVHDSCKRADGISLKFDTHIERSTVVGEARSKGQTLLQYAPAHKLSDQYRALAKELQKRIQEVIEEGREVTSAPLEPVQESREVVANG